MTRQERMKIRQEKRCMCKEEEVRRKRKGWGGEV